MSILNSKIKKTTGVRLSALLKHNKGRRVAALSWCHIRTAHMYTYTYSSIESTEKKSREDERTGFINLYEPIANDAPAYCSR